MKTTKRKTWKTRSAAHFRKHSCAYIGAAILLTPCNSSRVDLLCTKRCTRGPSASPNSRMFYSIWRWRFVLSDYFTSIGNGCKLWVREYAHHA